MEIRGLEKRFGDFVALQPLNLSIDEGEIFGFLGSNGAGKTTTIRMLTTLLEPSRGTALIHGKDIVKDQNAVRKLIGVVSDKINLYPDLSSEQNLRFFASLYGLGEKKVDERVKDVLNRVDLWDRRKDKIGGYSFGMRKRAEIACALVHEPKVLFMDEATTGIDPQNSIRIRNLALELAKEGMSIIWTTHMMEEPERLCKRVAIMSRGEVMAIGNPYELARLIEKEKTIEIRADQNVNPEQVQLLFGILRRQGIPATSENFENGVLKVVVDKDFDVTKVLTITQNFGYIHSINTLEPSLEDVFIHYTSGKGVVAA
ncbi:MAG: ABC transporter ATP-binding protein [Euryarchaeota archaeon]|nr:ABC transporter ATP-binding protein [Euryarchaeota archaeon]